MTKRAAAAQVGGDATTIVKQARFEDPVSVDERTPQQMALDCSAQVEDYLARGSSGTPW